MADSLSGDALRHSAPAYLAKLHRGVFLVLVGILVQLVVAMGEMFVGFALAAGSSGRPAGVDAVSGGIGFLLSVVILYGWWLLSEPDPAYAGRRTGQRARRVLRAALAVQAAAALGTFALTMGVHLAPGASAVLGILLIVVGLAELAALAVAFFASMLYIRWLTPRIPNPKAFKRAKTLMWLGPVLMTVGVFVLVGPLIALVLYWNMLDWIRKDLRRIRAEQAAGVPSAALEGA